MSTQEDRELLELAAKAAGYPLGVMAEGFFIAGAMTQEFKAPSIWNPLTDDGDALRLAVKLGIDIYQLQESVDAWIGEGPFQNAEESYGSDAYAAIRRAIVRAAAASATSQKGS